MTYDDMLTKLRTEVTNCVWFDVEGFTVADLTVGEIDMLADAVYKQIPKKPAKRIIDRGYNFPTPVKVEENVCPCCGVDTPVPRSLECWEFWCPDCGQKLDWSEE